MFFHAYEIKGNQRTAYKPLNYLLIDYFITINITITL